MNACWYSWRAAPANGQGNMPAPFTAMWRHVHNSFTAAGASNAVKALSLRQRLRNGGEPII
jgi:hypothetical protein